jgi:hypothetical protein
MPHISLFVVETHNFLERTQPQYARQVSPQYKPFLNYMRMKVKLFEEREIRNMLNWAANYQEAVFFRGHTGPLALLKKRLQCDLGLYSYDGHLISTTHLLFLYLTHNEDRRAPFDLAINDKLGPIARSVATDIGRYIGRLYEDLISPLPMSSPAACLYGIEDEQVQMRDVKSHVYLSTIFNGPASPEINLCLIMCLGLLNVAHFVMRQLTMGSPDTYFKLKYLTLYQVYVSLKNVRDFYYVSGLLSERSKQNLNLILDTSELNVIVKETKHRRTDKFRNVLVHYAIDEAGMQRNVVDPNKRLFGIVEHFFDGMTVEDLNDLVDLQMSKLSKQLEDWLKGEGE